jgi:uncharacterized membrane protein
MNNILSVANSLGLWVVCALMVSIVLIQALLIVRKCFKVAPQMNLTKEQCWNAIRSGAITAFAPSIGVLIVMLGLISSIGAPLAWSRLAIIGGVAMELGAADMGAKAYGVELGSAGYNMAAFANSAFTMAANTMLCLLFVGLFAHQLEKVRTKVAAGDSRWLAHLSAACMVGAIGYLVSGHLIAGGGRTWAAVSAAASMLLLLAISRKAKWLREYTLGLAMIIGMVVAVVGVI